MEIIGIAVRVAEIIVTTALLVILLMTYIRAQKNRIPNDKLLFITIGFGVFFIHALLAVPEIFSNNYQLPFDDNWYGLLIVIGLVFILYGTLRR